MKWNAQIISHTHWDREWYLNSKYTNEWLVPFFDSLFTMFEKEEAYQFVLDGQMSMIDDYYEELKKLGRPVYVYRSKIKKYVQEGRLHVGPYYLQPDWQLLSEESLVRNLLVGMTKAREYGTPMTTGWLLDNFGQISQTAQIHAEAGLQGLYAWRGVEMDPTNVQSEFVWESPDGTRLPTVYLLNSYRNVMRLAEYSDIMKARIIDEVEKLQDFMTTKNVLLMNGYDQEMVPDDIQPLIKTGAINTEDIEVVQSNPSQYLSSVLAEKPELMTLKGALYSGRFISVFPGVMSARMYLKLQNDFAQKLIEKYSEPLSLIDWLHGGDYDASTFQRGWELLLKNHPHDSICGVSIDDVHSDMEERSRDVHFLMDEQLRKSVKNLAGRIDTSQLEDNNYFLFNPSTYPRSEVVAIEGKSRLVEDIPALGYKLAEASLVKDPVVRDGKTISNSKIAVTINDNGTFNVLHKATGKSYEGLGRIEESGDAGDEYNYSYPDEDQYLYANDQGVEVSYEVEDECRVVVAVAMDMMVPVSVTEDRKQRKEDTTVMPIRTTITVEAGSDVVKVKTVIRNTAKDHIVRVLFPTAIDTKTSFAGSPFDVVERPIHIDDYDESMIPDNVRRVIVGAREAKPNTIFLGRELVDLNDGKVGLAVLSKGLPEYTVYEKDNTIALTLFRSVGWVAKEINTRIGDAGPEIFTPEAQCLREMTFEYAVYAHEGHYDEGGVLKAADRFNHDVMTFVTDQHPGSLPTDKSFISVGDKDGLVRVTGIKRAEDGNGLILRMYNGGEKSARATITTGFDIKGAKRVNFLEEDKEPVGFAKNSLSIDVGSKAIETIYLLAVPKSVAVNSADAEIYESNEPVNLEAYAYEPLVTLEDIAAEEARAEALKPGLGEDLYRRTALEAQLSAILARDRYHESQVYDLGYGLNEARVKRRVYDYIKDITAKIEKGER